MPKIRVIVEKMFNATERIYDENERNISDQNGVREDPVGFSFDSTPGDYYYPVVEGFIGGRGEYTLILKLD